MPKVGTSVPAETVVAIQFRRMADDFKRGHSLSLSPDRMTDEQYRNFVRPRPRRRVS